MNASWAGPSRRDFVRTLALGGIFMTTRGAFAEELMRTPRVTQGPFYPDRLPLGSDNDLIIVNDSITPAVGEITHLGGRVLDARGQPIRNAVVEIWQVDSHGIYLKQFTSGAAEYDRNFQGFGRFETGASGEYRFRTIKPVRYPSRPAPHIHFAVKLKGRPTFTTQLYVRGDSGNEHDGIYRSIGDPKARESVTVDFARVPDSRAGELAAKFDIVIGATPEA
jgi:protocatechuate 3,4-dioxygenase beta subunit